jgi:hypothetical protein
MKDVNIINIITFNGGILESVESFIISIGENSQKEISNAEKRFTDLIKELNNSFEDDDLESFVEGGYFSQNGIEIRFNWSDKVQ